MKQILFIHGAWGGAWVFQEVIKSLNEQGHQARAIDLPGHGNNEVPIPEITMQAYVDRVIEEARAIGEPIVLVGHSMSGAIISQVAERIPNQIECLVYVTAFLPRDGETALGLMQSDEDGQLLSRLVFSEDQSFVRVKTEDVKSLLLHDVKDAARVAGFAQKLDVRQATEPFMAVMNLTEEAFGSVPKVYLCTTLDKALSPALQGRMLSGWEVEQVYTMDTGHFPMMSQPEIFFEVISRAIMVEKIPTESN
jgi:pimeloyl-ACP methyl ester carboxylesterase